MLLTGPGLWFMGGVALMLFLALIGKLTAR